MPAGPFLVKWNNKYQNHLLVFIKLPAVLHRRGDYLGIGVKLSLIFILCIALSEFILAAKETQRRSRIAVSN